MLKVYYPRPPIDDTSRESDRIGWQVLASKLNPAVNFRDGLDIPDPADYDILISGRPTVEQLEASPNLHTVLIPWAGLPEATAELMVEYPDIAIHNLHHNAVTTAETALTLMMAAAKHLIPIERSFRAHDWRPRYKPNPALTLTGKTALILGYGHIGRHIGRVCAALGMRILAIRKNPVEDSIAEVHPPEALHQLLPKANILFLTLPLTDETRGLVGEKEIRLLPKGAVVINVGRGPVLDQHALYNALKDGCLHSAGVDVWYNYPPDEDSRANTPPADVPFHELDNIVMSPHRGGGSAEIEIRRMQYLAHFLNLAAAGEPLPNQINLERGY
jgi:phosphoglycerate dehydrogenase-like enzyme